MKALFVHQNIPAQYKHVLRRLAAVPGNEIVAISQPNQRPLPPGVRKVDYTPAVPPEMPAHRYLKLTEAAIRCGEAVLAVAQELKRQGFVPDIMVGHNAWGETLFLKDVWPDTPLLSYFEFFYQARGADTGFDPEFGSSPDDFPRTRMMNNINLLGLQAADWGHSPTLWQQSRFPAQHRARISIVHEGVDTNAIVPNPRIRLTLPNGKVVKQGDEVITYVSRSLEPYRGFHIFMRALPEVLRRRPNAQVLVVGGDDVSYGARLAGDKTYREVLTEAAGPNFDLSRVHFLGRVPYEHFLAVLQASAVHVYLTYPFVLSWSMLEAMSAGCLVLGSATPPVMEVIRDGENGLLVDFFDTKGIADRIDRVLDHPDRMAALRVRARATIQERYDVETVCLPQFLGLMDDLINRRLPRLPTPTDTAPPGAVTATAMIAAPVTTPVLAPAPVPVPAPVAEPAVPAGAFRITDVVAMARQAEREGNIAKAEGLYRALLEQRPDLHEASYEFAILLYKQGRGEEGVPYLERAIAVVPDRAHYHTDLGVIYKSQDRLEDRLAAYRRGLALDPGHPATLMNLGAALHDLGDSVAAEQACRRSLRVQPGQYGALTNLANVQVKIGLVDDALATYREALKHQPDHVEVRKNIGICLLLKGDFREGNIFYEARHQSAEMIRRDFSQPRWNGEPLNGKTVLLYAEQGMGDTLNFCRYAPMVKAMGGRVILEGQAPLIPVLKTLDGVDELVTYGLPLPAFDVCCPMLSLMGALGTELSTIPVNVPYLASEPERRARWKRRLPDTGRLKVGIGWAGSPTHQNDRHRSIPLKMWQPFIDAAEGVDFYGLQVGPGRSQIAEAGLTGRVIDLGDEIRDFADTAAIVDQLDLVIAIDTSLVHLTGALNRPVWVMITYAPDWRWLLDREDSPWYPSLRLFRQGPESAWEPVLEQVFTALREQTAGV